MIAKWISKLAAMSEQDFREAVVLALIFLLFFCLVLGFSKMDVK